MRDDPLLRSRLVRPIIVRVYAVNLRDGCPGLPDVIVGATSAREAVRQGAGAFGAHPDACFAVVA